VFALAAQLHHQLKQQQSFSWGSVGSGQWGGAGWLTLSQALPAVVFLYQMSGVRSSQTGHHSSLLHQLAGVCVGLVLKGSANCGFVQVACIRQTKPEQCSAGCRWNGLGEWIACLQE
jgi:hypothetical protein